MNEAKLAQAYWESLTEAEKDRLTPWIEAMCDGFGEKCKNALDKLTEI